MKQYFQKIKLAEDGQNPARPAVSLNKQATGRFIKQALAGNDRYDTERAEREAREKLLAARKSRTTRSAAPEPRLQLKTSAPVEQQEDLEDGELDQGDSMMIDVPAEESQSSSTRQQQKKGDRRRRKNPGHVNGDGVVKAQKAEKRRKRNEAGFQGNLEQELVKPG